MPNILYLHGFASSPNSRKGRFFLDCFSQVGADVHIPELVTGPFEKTTLSAQREVVERSAAEVRPCLIVGSSLGGYLAALHASRHPELRCGVVLLAPAFDFVRRWSDRLGKSCIDAWKQEGTLSVYHYGEQGMSPLGYRFYQDALQFEPSPAVNQPVLIFHGKYDEVVEPAVSMEFSRKNPDVELELLDSDHQLLNVLQPMWERTLYFCRRIEPFSSPGAYCGA